MLARDVCVQAEFLKMPKIFVRDKNSDEKVFIKYVSNFDLSQTFDCGQCFRWNKNENSYSGVVFGRELKAFSKEKEIVFTGTTTEEFNSIWKSYFDFSTDYKKIGEKLSNFNPVLKKAYEFCPGIRILKQDPWEALCSFIISQNNNIPRIKKIILSLCEQFGNKLESNYSFPGAEKLSLLNEKDLLPIKSGFRAVYILDAARKIASGEVNFQEIGEMPIENAREELKKIKGVGNKVADCVLLYGMHRLESFPMDVWMKRVMDYFFSGQTPKIFGDYAGIAQQYLYHYSRSNPEIFE